MTTWLGMDLLRKHLEWGSGKKGAVWDERRKREKMIELDQKGQDVPRQQIPREGELYLSKELDCVGGSE